MGGQLEATTYRPSGHFPIIQHPQVQSQTHQLQHNSEHPVAHRRVNEPSDDYRLLNNAIQNSPGFEITQPPFIQLNQYVQPLQSASQLTQPPHQLLVPGLLRNPYLTSVTGLDLNNYQPQHRQPVPYTPFNFTPQQTQEQLVYNNQFDIQNARLLQEQLSKQHNRFDLPQNSNYQHFG